MRKLVRWLPAFAVLGSVSCAFLLDFDGLKGEPGDAGTDTSVGGTSATGGASGAGGASGSDGAAGSGGGTGDAGDGGPLDQFPQQAAKALCDKISLCYGAATIPLIFGDASCEQLVLASAYNGWFAPAIDSAKVGKLQIDETKAAQCLIDFGDLPCSQVSLDFPEACRMVLKGKIAAGQKCSHQLECVPGHYCDLTGGCTKATCVAFGKQDAACSAGQLCAAGLGCLSGKCVPLAKAAEPCEGPSAPDCETGTICWGGSDTKVGTCVDSKDLFSAAPATACSSWWDALVGDAGTLKLCQVGAFCTILGFPPKCVGPLGGDAGGFPCQYTVPDQCQAGFYCADPDGIGGQEPVCTALPTHGEACGPATALKGRCAPYHTCDGTICRKIRFNGETGCASNAECYSGVCNVDVCTATACPIAK